MGDRNCGGWGAGRQGLENPGSATDKQENLIKSKIVHLFPFRTYMMTMYLYFNR